MSNSVQKGERGGQNQAAVYTRQGSKGPILFDGSQ